MTHENSWLSLWWNTLPEDLTHPLGEPLTSNVDVDVVIVGAGFTGLWTAYYLTLHDPTLRIAIIEAHRAGYGASGRNGGWASDLFPVDMHTVAATAGRDASIRLKRQMQVSIDEMSRVIHHEGWDVGWRKGGSLTLARNPLQLERVKREVEDMRRWGFGEGDFRFLSRSDVGSFVKATDVLGATYTPHCASVNPARLVRHLAGWVVERGVRLYEKSPVVSIQAGEVRTANARVRAPIVVRATEGYTQQINGFARTYMPVYSLMIATEPLPQSIWDEIGLQDRPTFTDGRSLIIYGQRTSDDRLAFGGRGAPYHFGSNVKDEFDRDTRVHTALWHDLTDLFPSVSEAAVTHSWGGPLAISRDWWASCGLDRTTGLAWSGGYAGDGVTTSNLGGRTLADLITGRETELITLPWVGHRSRAWEPEPLRWIAVTAAQRAVGYSDRVEARTGRTSFIGKAVSSLIGH